MRQHSLGLPETKGVVCSQMKSITAVYRTVPIRSDRFACPTLCGDRERTQTDNLRRPQPGVIRQHDNLGRWFLSALLLHASRPPSPFLSPY